MGEVMRCLQSSTISAKGLLIATRVKLEYRARQAQTCDEIVQGHEAASEVVSSKPASRKMAYLHDFIL